MKTSEKQENLSYNVELLPCDQVVATYPLTHRN